MGRLLRFWLKHQQCLELEHEFQLKSTACWSKELKLDASV